MALIKCKECKQEVSSEAKTCPKCGARIEKPTGCLTWIVVIILGFIALSVLINTSKTHTTNKSHSSLSSKAEQDCINEIFFKAAPGLTDSYEMRQEIYAHCKYAATNGIGSSLSTVSQTPTDVMIEAARIEANKPKNNTLESKKRWLREERELALREGDLEAVKALDSMAPTQASKKVVVNSKVSSAIKLYVDNNFGIPELQASWYKNIKDVTVLDDTVLVKTNLASYSEKISSICIAMSYYVFSKENSALGLQAIKIYSKNDTLLIQRNGISGICYKP